ncbi:Hypothetical predicted protein, partial [Mytilus galloprovincialis]
LQKDKDDTILPDVELTKEWVKFELKLKNKTGLVDRKDITDIIKPIKMQFLLLNHCDEIKEAVDKNFDKCNLTYSTEVMVVEVLSNKHIIFSEVTDILRNKAEELVIQIAPRTSRAKESLVRKLSAQVEDNLVHFFYDHEGRIHIVGFLEIATDIKRAVDNVKCLSSKPVLLWLTFDALLIELLQMDDMVIVLNNYLRQRNVETEWGIENGQLCIASSTTIDPKVFQSAVYEQFSIAGFSTKAIGGHEPFTTTTHFISTVQKNINKRLVQKQFEQCIVVASTKDIVARLLHEELKHNMCKKVDCDISLSDGLKTSTKKWSCYIKNENTLYQNILQHLRHLEEQFKCTLLLEIQHPSIQYVAQCVNWDKGIHVVLVCGTAATLLTDDVVWVSDRIDRYRRVDHESPKKLLWNIPYLGVPDQEKVIHHLQEILAKIEEEKLNSLAIPLKMCDSLPEVTLLQHFNAAFYKSELKHLKVIYLCYEDIKMTERLTMMLKSGPSSLNFYDFSKVPTYRDEPLNDEENSSDITFKWTVGNIIDEKTDIIVNSTNRELQLQKGAVSLLILEKVGKCLSEDCHDKYPNGIDYGSLAITSGGKFWKSIYHFALPLWTANAEFSTKILEQAVYNCLIQAEKDKCKSIVFPVFGTGKLKYPWGDVARTMRNAFGKFMYRYRHINLKEMRVVLHPDDKKSIEAFETGIVSDLELFSEEFLHQTKSILEARCNDTKIIILHLPSTRFHQSDALITISNQEQASSVLKDSKDGMIKDKRDCSFWSIKVFCSNNTNYKKNMANVVQFILEERLSTITISLLENDDSVPLRTQSKIIRDLVLENENNRYLQLVKLIVLDIQNFASLLSETEQRKHNRQSTWMPPVKDVLRLSKPRFKAVTYTETSQLPKLIISAQLEDINVVTDLQEKLKKSLNN